MTRGGGDDGGDALSAATREAAAHARRRAREEVPTAGDLASMTTTPSRPGLSRAEIRHLAAEAIENAQKISYLLGRLVELSGEEDGP